MRYGQPNRNIRIKEDDAGARKTTCLVMQRHNFCQSLYLLLDALYVWQHAEYAMHVASAPNCPAVAEYLLLLSAMFLVLLHPKHTLETLRD